jgi:hypothetical protein
LVGSSTAGSPEHLEDLVEAGLARRRRGRRRSRRCRGDADGQVALGDLEDQVDLVLALDGAGLDGLDERGPVVRVDDGLATANVMCV